MARRRRERELEREKKTAEIGGENRFSSCLLYSACVCCVFLVLFSKPFVESFDM